MKRLNKALLPALLAIGIVGTGPATASKIADVDLSLIDGNVVVKVDGEVATLRGDAGSLSDIIKIQKSLEKVDGIKKVRNLVRIRPK